MMNRVVFDIETMGFPFESFDETQQEYLLKFAKNEEERLEAVKRLSLTPFTAQILAIGMLNPDTKQGKVFYQGEGLEPELLDEGLVQLIPCTEPEILMHFWKSIIHYKQFVTFNGRGFDCPFIMARSAVLSVKPSRNLMGNRYAVNDHCDLLDQLTFYGAMRKFNLDFYCKAFGIRSPKEGGVTGADVGRLFGERKFREIAGYCLGDVKATAELFKKWAEYLSV